jgi:hypothetical protein
MGIPCDKGIIEKKDDQDSKYLDLYICSCECHNPGTCIDHCYPCCNWRRYRRNLNEDYNYINISALYPNEYLDSIERRNKKDK